MACEHCGSAALTVLEVVSGRVHIFDGNGGAASGAISGSPEKPMRSTWCNACHRIQGVLAMRQTEAERQRQAGTPRLRLIKGGAA